MGRKDSIGEIVLQLEKLDDESLEYLSHWSMPWGVLPLLHGFEDGRLMRDVDCDTHVALECQDRDERLEKATALMRDMWPWVWESGIKADEFNAIAERLREFGKVEDHCD